MPVHHNTSTPTGIHCNNWLFLLFLFLTTTCEFWEPTLTFSGKSFLGEKTELLSQVYGMNEYNKTIE